MECGEEGRKEDGEVALGRRVKDGAEDAGRTHTKGGGPRSAERRRGRRVVKCAVATVLRRVEDWARGRRNSQVIVSGGNGK